MKREAWGSLNSEGLLVQRRTCGAQRLGDFPQQVRYFLVEGDQPNIVQRWSAGALLVTFYEEVAHLLGKVAQPMSTTRPTLYEQPF